MIKRMSLMIVGGMAIMAALSGYVLAVGPPQQSSAVPLQGQVSGAEPPSVSPPRALLNQYCVSCHSKRLRTAGLALDEMDLSNPGQSAEVWEKVVRKLRGGLMPPTGRPRPDDATQEAFVSWLETELDRAAAAHPNPGRTETLHRLNRAEYRNAIRDLLALDVDVTELLPADDASYGFDNMAGVLKLNQAQMERYLSAALKVSRAAVGSPLPAPTGAAFRISPEASQYEHVEGLPFGTRGGTLIRYYFPRDGEYEIKVALMCTTQIDSECNGSVGFSAPHELQILIDGELVKSFTLKPREVDLSSPNQPTSEGPIDKEERWSVRLPVKAGPREVGVTFVKGAAVEYVKAGYRKRFEKPFRFRADPMFTAVPFVDHVEITGPFTTSGSGETPSRRAILTCHPTSPADEAPCATTILSRLARRAYRRPVTETEVQELLTFYKQGRREEGGTFESGIELALRRLLMGTKALFRVERDPANIAPGTNYRINDLELASRLSFFLWSSIPDDQLLDVAAKGKLKDPAVIEQQVRRMLADARSRALVENFFGQWLELRHVDSLRPSEQLFPNFDATLRDAFRRETELFVEHIIREDRSVLEMLTADYTFVNERLARHYGIPQVKGSRFRRVTYGDDRRRGLLGQGSILTLTSHATRTSPVIRGKWILENVMGTPPPAPPANVPVLPETEDGSKQVLSIRDRMAKHRANPVCASCHSMIDPAGFALENFDPVGQWRSVDEAFNPVDVVGALPDGTKFKNLGEFRQALVSHPERFVTNFTEKVLTYALGRGLEYYDQPAVRKITTEAARGNYRFSSIVLGIVNSLPFQTRRSKLPAGQLAASHR